MTMSYPPAPAPINNGMAKGAAIASIINYSLSLLGLELIVLFAKAILVSAISELGTESGMGEFSSLIDMFALVTLVALGIPIGLSVWMLLSARRGELGQLLAALIIFTVVDAIIILPNLYFAIMSPTQVGSLFSYAPTIAILVIGWVGWSRMKKPPQNWAPVPQNYAYQQGYAYQLSGYPYQQGYQSAPAWPAVGQAPAYGALPQYGSSGSYGSMPAYGTQQQQPYAGGVPSQNPTGAGQQAQSWASPARQPWSPVQPEPGAGQPNSWRQG